MYICLGKRIWFTIIFLPPKDVILSDLELSRIELPKLSVLMEITVFLVGRLYFCMHQPIKVWLFGK